MGRMTCFVNSSLSSVQALTALSLRVVNFNGLFEKFFSSGNPVALSSQGHFNILSWRTRDVIILVCLNRGVSAGCRIRHDSNQRWRLSDIVAVKLRHQR